MSDDVTLYCGECAEVMAREIPDGSIDLTVTSPPYDNLRTYKGYHLRLRGHRRAVVARDETGRRGGVGGGRCDDQRQRDGHQLPAGAALHGPGLQPARHDDLRRLNRPPVTANRYEPGIRVYVRVLQRRPASVESVSRQTHDPAGTFIGSGLRYPNGDFNGRREAQNWRTKRCAGTSGHTMSAAMPMMERSIIPPSSPKPWPATTSSLGATPATWYSIR